MAFFLIGRGPDNDLQFLSDRLFDSRPDAMTELSRITADSSFSQWDSEVFVMDLAQGAPVLLVRPKNDESPARAFVAPSSGASEDDTGDVASSQADTTELEPTSTAVSDSEDVEASLPDESSESSADDTSEVPLEEEEPEELRQALHRTTEQMTAQGIVPPESAGLQETAPAEATPTPDAVEEVSTTEPVLDEGQVAGQDPPPEPLEQAVSAPWPWDAQPEAAAEGDPPTSPDIATVYEALDQPEEPASTAEEVAHTESEDDESDDGESDFILDLDSVQPLSMVPVEAPEQEASETLEQPTAAGGPAVAVASEDSPLAEYTCNDCVYVETCPNRDQRAPADCGNFQWK